MYKTPVFSKTIITRNTSVEGETLETKIERMMSNKEPIKDGAPLIYTQREDGVLPNFNVRADKQEIAIDAMDKVSASYEARRQERLEARKPKEKDGEAEPPQGTEQPQ